MAGSLFKYFLFAHLLPPSVTSLSESKSDSLRASCKSNSMSTENPAKDTLPFVKIEYFGGRNGPYRVKSFEGLKYYLHAPQSPPPLTRLQLRETCTVFSLLVGILPCKVFLSDK